MDSIDETKNTNKNFDEMLFAGFIDYIEVSKDKKIVIFKDGKRIEI